MCKVILFISCRLVARDEDIKVDRNYNRIFITIKYNFYTIILSQFFAKSIALLSRTYLTHVISTGRYSNLLHNCM